MSTTVHSLFRSPVTEIQELVQYQQARMPIDQPQTGDQAKRLLCESIRGGYVIYSKHFKEELINDGLTIGDILLVCRSGAISMAPERDSKRGVWKYRIEGLTADRDLVAVVFTFDPQKRAVFITAFKRNHG